MRFFQVVLSGAALFAAALALELNEVPTALEAGKTYTITYSPKDNTPTTFILRKGDPNDLDTIGTIGTATGGSFTWTVPTDLVDGPDYAFEVQQEGVAPNYSGLIPLTGGTGEEDDDEDTSSSSTMSSGYPTKSTPMSTPATPTPTDMTKSTPKPSGTGSMTTPGMNSTITSATLSRTTSGGNAPTSTGGGSPPAEQTGAAAIFGSSPLALLVGAAAMAYLN